MKLLFTLCLLIASAELSSEAWPLPIPLETGHLLGAGRPAGKPPVPLVDELSILGMGSNNVIALLERSQVGSSWRVRTKGLDLVNDSVLWQQDWEDWGDEDLFSLWWETHRNEISIPLQRWKISPLNYQLGEFPVILDEEYYQAFLRRTNDVATGLLARLEVILQSTGRGVKTVLDLTGTWRWATLLGFVPSPFENRLALVLLIQPEGWAGDQQPLRFLVTGASLKAGFELP